MNGRWVSSLGTAPIDCRVDVEPYRDTVKLIPAGELDPATAEQLQRELDELIEAGFGRIVIDLLRLRFIDSTAVNAPLPAHERGQPECWQPALVPGRPAVQRQFEISGRIEQVPSVSAATNSGPPASELPHRPNGVEHASGARNQLLAGTTLHLYPKPM